MYGVPDCSENEDGQDHRHVKSYRWVAATLFGCLAPWASMPWRSCWILSSMILQLSRWNLLLVGSSFCPRLCGYAMPRIFAPLFEEKSLPSLLRNWLPTGLFTTWTVPACCFGSVSGKGLPEALYIAKHAAQSSAAIPNGALFVQLDLSQAFDSLFVNAIPSFLQDHWLASTASSASLLRWVLLHSRLRFELFDFVWWCDQRRGTQQGGSHSPTLFGRLVAARFEQLTQTWQLQGEHPAFVAATLSLRALWFIDDAILVFQTVAQALRLLPQVVSMLAGLGLSINVAKFCVLGCSLSCALLGCLAAFPVVATSKYLGLPFQVTGEDDHMINSVTTPRLRFSPTVPFWRTVWPRGNTSFGFLMPLWLLPFAGPCAPCLSDKMSSGVFACTKCLCLRGWRGVVRTLLGLQWNACRLCGVVWSFGAGPTVNSGILC